MIKTIIFFITFSAAVIMSITSSSILKTGIVKKNQANIIRDWTTYQNKQHGFQIKYDNNDFIVNTKFTGLVDNDKRILELNLINGKYYRGTNLDSAGLYIIMDEATQFNCLNPPKDMGILISIKEVDINGTTFIMSETEEGAMSHTYEKNIYSTIRNNKCYRIVLFISTTEIGAFDPGTVAQFRRAEVLEKLHEVITTFQFIELIQ